MKRRINILAAVLILAISGTLWAESASVLLEKGLYNEETKGDLDAAITVYKQIIDNAQANRQYVAQAHYRLGMCYAKKGQNQDALAAFEKLVTEYSDEKQLSAQAQKQIAQLRASMSQAEIAKVVKEAVLTISTCTETDRRVKESLTTLQGLNEEATVTALSRFLDSDKNTIRR